MPASRPGQSESKWRFRITLFLGVFIAIGCWPLYKAIQNIRKAEASRSWPTVPGVIVESTRRVSTSQSREEKRRMKSTQSYYADVKYSYEVNGTKYEGDQVSVLSGGIGSESSAEAIIKRYPRDAKVSVAYNPQNPAEAFLEPGSWGSTWMMLVFAGGFIGVPLLLIKAMWSKPRGGP